jgi:hypothetical protein
VASFGRGRKSLFAYSSRSDLSTSGRLYIAADDPLQPRSLMPSLNSADSGVVLPANRFVPDRTDPPTSMFLSVRVLAKIFKGLAVVVMLIGAIAALLAIIGGLGPAAALTRVGGSPPAIGAGLVGGVVILLGAGLQAFLLWVLGDILALLLLLERRTRHGLRLQLDLADACPPSVQ